MGSFLFKYEFWWRFLQDFYTSFARKTAFVKQNFRSLGAFEGGVKIFDEILNRHILGWFHSFWAIDRANLFSCMYEKRDITKSHRDYMFKISLPDFLYNEKFWKLDHDFRYF